MDGKLSNFPYILGTGVLGLLIYEDFPPILLTTTFSNFVQPLPPTSLSSQTSTPIVFSVALFIWLNEWSGHIWCAILCNDKMDLHLSSLHTKRTLICILCNKVPSFLMSDTWDLLLWFDITQKKQTQHTQWAVGWHTHINILNIMLIAPHVMYSKQLPVLNSMINE